MRVSKRIQKIFRAFGTLNSFTVYGDIYEGILDKARDMLLMFHSLWSVFDPGSEISLINRHAGEKAVTVSDDTFRIIELAQQYHRDTFGTYDITAGLLYEIWKKALSEQKLPDLDNIRGIAQKHADTVKDSRTIELDAGRSAVRLRKGAALDLGGIAKGYAANAVRNMFIDAGINHAMINLGGSVTVIGNGHNVGIRNPFSPDTGIIGHIQLSDRSMVTSGTYEQYFIQNGNCFHHVIDPRTGLPADSGLVSATLIGNDPTALDAYATAVLILGAEQGLPFLLNKEMDAVMITNEGSVLITPGLKDRYTPNLKIQNIGG